MTICSCWQLCQAAIPACWMPVATSTCRIEGAAWNALSNVLLPCRDELLFAVAAAAGAPCGMPLTGVAACKGRAIPIVSAWQKTAVCDHEGKAMRCSCMPCNLVAVGLISTKSFECAVLKLFRSVGLPFCQPERIGECEECVAPIEQTNRRSISQSAQ